MQKVEHSSDEALNVIFEGNIKIHILLELVRVPIYDHLYSLETNSGQKRMWKSYVCLIC